MASSAGFQLSAGRIPGELIASSVEVADSANFTAETQVMTITAPLVTGRTYSVWASPTFQSSVSADQIRGQLREDDTSGTVLDMNDAYEATSALLANVVLFALYTATATADKTFVVTGNSTVGTGNCRLEAAATRPAHMLVRYETG